MKYTSDEEILALVRSKIPNGSKVKGVHLNKIFAINHNGLSVRNKECVMHGDLPVEQGIYDCILDFSGAIEKWADVLEIPKMSYNYEIY